MLFSAQGLSFAQYNPDYNPLFGSTDLKVREWRMENLPSYKTGIDNFTCVSPALVMFGMKACGLESKSDWKTIHYSSALSTALMLGSTTLVKYTTDVMRPDHSTQNSFPSGHTATAFMCATLLHKEYGRTYPWVSACGFAVATATGASRIANNRHWLSDVLFGALFGYLSAEAGTYLSRLLLR